MPPRTLRGFDPTRLKEARDASGMSRSDLARLAGVPYNSLRRWEIGEADPTLDSLEQVAAALDIDVSEIAIVHEQSRTLQNWRALRGLSQQDVADAVKTSTSSYSRIERGESPLSDDMRKRLGEALSIDDATVSLAWQQAHYRPPRR